MDVPAILPPMLYAQEQFVAVKVAEPQPPEERRQPESLGAVAHDTLATIGKLSEEEKAVLSKIGLAAGNIVILASGVLELEEQLQNSIDTAHRLREKVAELTIKVETDKLTGALSEEALEHVFSEVAIEAAEQNKPMFVLFADLDGLKVVNDFGVQGHESGDEYLVATVAAIRQYYSGNVRIIRRSGSAGDEFIIIGTLSSGRRQVDSTDEINREHHKGLAGLRTHVAHALTRRPLLRVTPLLREHLENDKERKIEQLGISVGGTFVMPEDVHAVGQEVLDGHRTIRGIFSRLEGVADIQMYHDKKGTNGTTMNMRFEAQDLYPAISKFQPLEKEKNPEDVI